MKNGMAIPNSERHPFYNPNLLAKREETQRIILKELSEIKVKISKIHDKVKQDLNALEQKQDESSSLTHKSAILSAEIAKIKRKIHEIENDVKEIIFQIDGMKPKQMLASIVLEKEENTLKSYYNDMMERERFLKRFWNNSAILKDNAEISSKSAKLQERQDALEKEIGRLNEKYCSFSLNKLNEEYTSLRKLNESFLKRKIKILDDLEKQVYKRKEEVTQAKRSITFWCS